MLTFIASGFRKSPPLRDVVFLRVSINKSPQHGLFVWDIARTTNRTSGILAVILRPLCRRISAETKVPDESFNTLECRL